MAKKNDSSFDIGNVQTATEVQDHLNGKATSQNKLGELIWWSMRDVEILRETVVKLVDSIGIRDPNSGKAITSKEICPKLQARGGLLKALAELNIKSGSVRGTIGTKDGQKKRAPVPGLEGRVLFCRRLTGKEDPTLGSGFSMVLVEEKVSSSKWEGVEVQRITYSPDTKKLNFTNDLLKSEIERGFSKYARTYRAAEVTRMVHDLIDTAHGIVARESGGVYFLPRQTVAIGRYLDSICAGIEGADLTRFPVLDIDEAGEKTNHREKTLTFAGKQIRRELVEMQKKMAVAAARTNDEDAAPIRSNTLKNRIDEFKVLKQKAKTYRELLGLQDEKIKNALNKLTREARKLITGNEEKRDRASDRKHGRS